VQTLSQQLSLPRKTDLRASQWSSWSGCATSTAQQSWFSTRLLKVPQTTTTTTTNYETTYYSQSQLSLWHAKTAAGQQRIGSDAKRANKKVKTNKEQPNTTRRIRLEPTKEQKKELLKQWMGTNRWTYNRAVASQLTTKKELRQKFVNNDVFADEPTKRWVLDTPYDVRECAITDLTKAIKSTKALLKTGGHIKKFKMKFRSKKDRQQSINVRNRLYKSEGEKAFSFLRGSFECAKVDPVIKAREPLASEIDYDARLARTRLGEWYLCIPMAVAGDEMPRALGDESQVPFTTTMQPNHPVILNNNNNNNNNTEEKRVCSLDPGVRTFQFQTVFDASTGAVIEVGAGDLARFYRLCDQADKLQSRHDQTHGKKRYKLRRGQLRIYEKIRRLVKAIDPLQAGQVPGRQLRRRSAAVV
jgi:hypothetical protein